MQQGSFTDQTVHAWLQEVADKAFISLHYDTPALGAVGANEISGGGYVRVRIAFSQPTNRAIWSLEDARFTGLTQNRITHFGIWDGKKNGSLVAYAPLPEVVTILNGWGYVLRQGELSISIG